MGHIARRSVFSGLALVLAAPHVARAGTRAVRFGNNNTKDSHYGRGAAAFKRAVAEEPALSGVIAVEVHNDAVLGDELGMLKDITRGTLDMMLCSGSIISNVVAEIGLLNAPFLFRDANQARSAMDGALGAEYAELARGKDATVLAWGENGLRHITSNRPVRTPGDLRGLKIRVPQAEVILGGFRALGAAAEPLSFNLLREALRTGQFEAQENALASIESIKLYELQSQLSLTGHIYDPAAILASSDLLEDLTDVQRKALAACAARAAAVTREVADVAQSEGIMRLKAAGMQVQDGIDKAAFAAAARPFIDGLSGRFGADRVKRLMAAVATGSGA